METWREGDTKSCPVCGDPAVYSERTAIVDRNGRVYKDRQPGPHTRYAHGWACSNGACDFSEELPMQVPS